jgi:pimeloyl-ACP methyl ester carboxylesterase
VSSAPSISQVVKIPMLFLQGAKDEFADLDLLKPTVAKLGKRAKLHLVEHADHAFHVPPGPAVRIPKSSPKSSTWRTAGC